MCACVAGGGFITRSSNILITQKNVKRNTSNLDAGMSAEDRKHRSDAELNKVHFVHKLTANTSQHSRAERDRKS